MPDDTSAAACLLVMLCDDLASSLFLFSFDGSKVWRVSGHINSNTSGDRTNFSFFVENGVYRMYLMFLMKIA
jgi:hypothetical protein